MKNNYGLRLPFPDYFVLTRQVLVHEFLSELTVESDECPAASRPINGIGIREFSIFAIKIAEFHRTLPQNKV